MLSKRIWVDRPKPPIINTNILSPHEKDKKAVIFEDQTHYLQWLGYQDRIPIGRFLIWKANTDVTVLNPSSFKVVIGYQSDLTNLAWSYDGSPKYLLTLEMTPGYSGFHGVEYVSDGIFRAFTDDEMEWAKNNVELQKHLKDALSWYEANFG